MRVDTLEFARANLGASKSPRYVIGVVYTISSPHFTSHPGIANVPGVPVQNTIRNIRGTSQRLSPDEARSTIGNISFDVVDLAGAVTSEIRTQLDTNGEGIRGAEVQVYVGYTDDFDDYVRVATQQVDQVQLSGSTYRISCADVQRQMRSTIFDFKTTRLTADLTATATTITVDDTTGFETVAHTSSFSDAPSSTVGYIRVKKTGEIIRYTGKTATTFTGLTRGVFNTVGRAVDIDETAALDQLPEIEEFIYLEAPLPQLAYALLTGSFMDVATTLPSHWHLGISTTLVDIDQFRDIGLDLYDSSNQNNGLVLLFSRLGPTDGKRFIEKELLLLMGGYMPVDALGKLGLRRIVKLLSDAPSIATVDESNSQEVGNLIHDQRSLINRIRIDWNFNGEEFTRSTLLIDAASISIHGEAPIKTFQFRGLTADRHTQQTLQQIFQTYVDRYGEPPQRLSRTLMPSMNFLEPGDVVRVKDASLRDYENTGTLDRSMEIQQAQIDWITGRVRVELFGTARETPAINPPGTTVPLPDSWYTQEGTALSSVLTIASDVVTANGTITGNADLNNTGAIFYHDGPLTIQSGVTVTIANNVQLRIKGFLQIDGRLEGVGGGLAGVASNQIVDTFPVAPILVSGTPGFIGTTRGSEGMFRSGADFFNRQAAGTAVGRHSAMPVFELELTGLDVSPVAPVLKGLPDTLMGTSGGPGSDFQRALTPLILQVGGTGGASGAGLAIICRGLGFGVSGEIDLSGDPGSAQAGTVNVDGKDLYAGAGGGGAPGGCLVLLDGHSLALPDFTGKFVADRGNTPVLGTLGNPIGPNNTLQWSSLPGTGTDPGLGTENLANSHLRIQYVPSDDAVGDGADEVLAPPASTAATRVPQGIRVTWTDPPDPNVIGIQVLRSVNNVRNNAVIIDEVLPGIGEYLDVPPSDGDYFYWTRSIDRDGNTSDFAPDTTTTTATVFFVRLRPVVEFFDTFDNYVDETRFAEAWELVQNQAQSTVTFADEIGGEEGGRVVRFTGENWWVSKDLVPFNEKTLYRVSVRMRVTTRPTNAAQDLFYCGVSGVAEDGTTLINISGVDSHGSQHYFAASAFDTGALTLNEWNEFYGYFLGTASAGAGGQHNDPSDPGFMFTTGSPPPACKYVRPLLIANHDNSPDGVVEVAWLRIEALDGFLLPNLADPTFDLNVFEREWLLVDAANTTVSISENTGESGSSNSLRFAHTTGALGGGTADIARLMNAVGGRRFTIKVRYKSNRTSGSGNVGLAITATPYEVEQNGRKSLSADAIDVEEITLTSDNTWRTAIFFLQLVGSRTTAGRFRLTDTVADTLTAYTLDIDRVEVVQYDQFLGAASKGYIPDPVTEVGGVLLDDGAWEPRFQLQRSGNTMIAAVQSLVAGDTSNARIDIEDVNGVLGVLLGFNSSANDAEFRNLRHGGDIWLRAEDAGGTIRFLLAANADGRCVTYYDGNEAIETSDRTASGAGSAGRVRDTQNVFRPIGLGVAVPKNHNSSYTVAQADMQGVLYSNSHAGITLTVPNESVIPAGAMFPIVNHEADDITIARGASANLFWQDGSGGGAINANRTLAGRGAAMLWKHSNGNWFIWGIGLT